MKKLIALSLLVLLSTIVIGQTDSLRKEILNYSNSKSSLIMNARSLLLDKFLEGKYEKVDEIKDYMMTELDDTDYIALYPAEFWLISYWTNDFQEILSSIHEFDSTKIASLYSRIQPINDMLLQKLKDSSIKSKHNLDLSINNSEFGLEDKYFLLMHLNFLLNEKSNPDVNQDTLNIIADNYLSRYPNNLYTDFTRKYIRYKMIPSKWGFTAEFFSGYGIFTSNLDQYYTNNIPIGVAFDIYYKNVALFLRDYIGFSKTKNDVIYSNGIWEEGSQVRVFLPEASIGYVALDNRFLKAIPFIGIASTDIGPTQYDLNQEPGLDEVELEFTTTFSIGFNLDIKLGNANTAMVTYSPEQSYWFLRLRYSYNLPKFQQKYDGYYGNMHYITIGVGGFGRKLIREY